jgi:SAM-dependent methyltransferase
VLELAAGTGRLAVPIARRGPHVVGLDVSPSMLAQAEAKATGNAEFLLGDMRSFGLGRSFDLVLIACSSLCHLLTDADLAACFASVRAHLRPGGVFALDVATPHSQTATADGTWRARFSYPDPAGAGTVSVRGRRRYDPAARLLTDELDYTFGADGRVERATRISRMYPFDELKVALAKSGFAVGESYGGFDRRPLTENGDTQILLCTTER